MEQTPGLPVYFAQNCGNVVPPAMGKGRADQLHQSLLQRAGGHNFFDLRGGDHIGQAVGADEIGVPGLTGALGKIGLQQLLAGRNAQVLQKGRLYSKGGDGNMVLGYLLHSPAGKPEDFCVPDIAERHHAGGKRQHRRGGPHGGDAVRVAIGANIPVGLLAQPR